VRAVPEALPAQVTERTEADGRGRAPPPHRKGGAFPRPFLFCLTRMPTHGKLLPSMHLLEDEEEPPSRRVRRLRRLAAVAAVPGATLLGAAAARRPQSSGASDPLTEQRLRAHLSFLADDLLDGRFTGSPTYEIAARYVAAQWRQLGLRPVAG